LLYEIYNYWIGGIFSRHGSGFCYGFVKSVKFLNYHPDVTKEMLPNRGCIIDNQLDGCSTLPGIGAQFSGDVQRGVVVV
jgi:hypothetical protein